jgi:UDP-2,3-diacylglucosamine hydrolase
VTECLFISDLHLSRGQPVTVELFLQFLDKRASRAKRLYILGDLFDAWVGDDDVTPPIPQVTNALRKLTRAGTQVYIQHGNRDFLMGEAFMAATGCQLLPDPYLMDLFGTPTLLMHGDLLCSDDLEYQQTRKRLRSEAFIREFLSHSVEERITIAAEYRKRSGEVTSLKAEEIMDVNQETVVRVMQEQGAMRLIHGHTHRPGIHALNLDGKPAQRIVLSDWHPDRGSVLSITNNGIATEAVVPH